ncbi:MAG TPA: UDP-N-acetylglucosamine 4,6-dehydratase [bacterium]|nr:UDP-N-acetylglucosamine 4,6-dehydratase [bacterium]
MDILSIIGRDEKLFNEDIAKYESYLKEVISSSSFLVIGGAGSIGQAVVIEIFKRNPKKLHVVDISENNLVELVRNIRSSLGYTKGEFATFAIDCGSDIFDIFWKMQGGYDFVFNLSALKHVRSEKDPYTLMRMIDVNILNTLGTIDLAKESGTKKYFCVSTDKAANPVNMMGASKRIMEMFLMYESRELNISTARFANVAFSDGSLLYGFHNRIMKRQPISAPNDVKRYFVTQQESGELCLMSGLVGQNRDIFFPKLNEKLNLIKFSDIAVKFLENINYSPYLCETEDEARDRADELIKQGKWPCYFFESDTTGEKDFEEFFTEKETVEMNNFKDIGVIKNKFSLGPDLLSSFTEMIYDIKKRGSWSKKDIVEIFFELIPDFDHEEKNKYLDSRM